MRADQANRTWLFLLAVLVCVAGFSAGRFANGFVHDDLPMLRAGLIDDPSRIGEVFAGHALIAHGTSDVRPMDTYRPISILSFFWDAWLSGHSPWSYHLTNLLLHLACVVCVFVWIRRLLPQASLWVVASASLFFGLSPQLVEAHVWINGRSDPLVTLFGVGALLLWQRPGPRSWQRGVGVGLLFLCGLLSKEVLLFTLPAILFWPVPDHASSSARLPTRLRQMTPFLSAAAVYLGMRTWALGGLRSSRDLAQLHEAARNLPILWLDGLQELLWPSQLYLRGLREEYASLGAVHDGAAVVLTLSLVVLSFLARRRLPILSWSLAWYALSLAPAALISAVLWPGFGRYLYMPCAGLALGVAEVLTVAEGKVTSGEHAKPSALRASLPSVMRVVMLVYILFFGVRLVQYTRDYVDERTLYAAAISSAPERASGYARMAGLLVTEGKVEEAMPLYLQAIARDPSEPSYALQAIFWNLRSRQFMVAERLARNAITHAPAEQVGAFRSLLMRALAERDPQAAVAELCVCLTQDPDEVRCSEAPQWLLHPRATHSAELRGALLRFAETCPSLAAQRALARSLRASTGLRP